MSDLSTVLPNLDLTPYSRLLFSLEKNAIKVSDLVTLDPVEIVRKCPLPLADVRRLVAAVIQALPQDTKAKGKKRALSVNAAEDVNHQEPSKRKDKVQMLKTLDSRLDESFGGGFMPGSITEIVGESAVGKTQFVLGLLLSVQLPPPHGLGRSAIYISTESKLSTSRLLQMLKSHPVYLKLEEADCPTLDRVHSIAADTLEKQEHIIQYQLPVAVERYNVGLIVMDSVAANFRAEHDTRTPSGLMNRASDLTRLGNSLKRIAINSGAVIVVTNQVADRFDDSTTRMAQERVQSSSPGISSSRAPLQSDNVRTNATRRDEVLTLDHQQRFFSGWGADSESSPQHENLKTPALGLAWTNQLSARIALKLEADRYQGKEYSGGNIWSNRKRRRFASVVFAPWTQLSLDSVEYEITESGIVSLDKEKLSKESSDDPHQDLLKAELWEDEDEEFP